MLKSMTGFGRGEHTGQIKQVIVEMKSVNHRYSEVVIKMPRQYSLLEESIRRHILGKLSRGRVEVYIKIEDTGEKSREVQVDKDLALAYYKALKELATITGTSTDIGVVQLAQLPDVLQIEEREEDIEQVMADLLPAVNGALNSLLLMREQEGAKLKTDLVERLQYIENVHKKIELKSQRVVELYSEKLQNRLKEILDEKILDENRLAMEVAILADRSSITEELVRLHSHFQQFNNILREKNAVGRKLDFLLQEMNREINTIGSKANDLEITQQVVEMKSELEKIREQIQNIE